MLLFYYPCVFILIFISSSFSSSDICITLRLSLDIVCFLIHDSRCDFSESSLYLAPYLYRNVSEPIRLVVVLPRLSDVSDLRKAICQMLSPAASKSSNTTNNAQGNGLPHADHNHITPPASVLLPENLTLLDCYHEGGLMRNVLDDRESVLQLIDSINRNTVASTTIPTSRAASGIDIDIASGSFDSKSGVGRHRSESISIGSTPATSVPGQNASKIGVEDPYANTMTLSCLAVENPKNIPFILSLSSSQLVSRNAGGCVISYPPVGDSNVKPSKEEGTLPLSITPSSVFDNSAYTDELEYLDGGRGYTEGDMVTDIDFDAHINCNQQTSTISEGVDCDAQKIKKGDTSAAKWPKSIEGLAIGRRVDALDHRSQWFSGTIVDKWKVTPEDMMELQLDNSASRMVNGNSNSNGNGIIEKGRRKSKSDSTGSSHSGSGSANSKYAQIGKDGFNNLNGVENYKGPKSVGWNVRIHFDNFSGKWDEWFSASDHDYGRIARVYKYCSRKLKVLEIIAVQRLITLKNVQYMDGPPSKVLNVKIFGYPLVLQCESFRSCEHVHSIVAEQSVRYATEGQMRQMVESVIRKIPNSKNQKNGDNDSKSYLQSSSDTNLPFTIRILSSTAPLATEGLEGLEVDLGLPEGRDRVRLTSRRGSPGEVQTQYRKSRSGSGLGTPGDDEKRSGLGGYGVQYASACDRANGYQLWEGSFFPRDPLRPICNLQHPRLMVAVDWHCNATGTGTGIHSLMGHSIYGANGNDIKKGVVRIRDHVSYSKYMMTLIPAKHSTPPISPRKNKDSDRETNGSSVHSGGDNKRILNYNQSNSQDSNSNRPVGAESNDAIDGNNNNNNNENNNSNGNGVKSLPLPLALPLAVSSNPSLEDCLKSFTGTEELDEGSWYCDHCKKLSSGSVSSSLSRLPDLLILHIKRFGMTARFREKIRAKVKFPLSSLDMKPFVTPYTSTGIFLPTASFYELFIYLLY